MKKLINKLGVTLCIAALVTVSGCGKKDTTEKASVTEAITTEAATTEAAKDKAETEAAESTEASEPAAKLDLPDGDYIADVETDSTMFRINDTLDGKGRLTVKEGRLVPKPLEDHTAVHRDAALPYSIQAEFRYSQNCPCLCSALHTAPCTCSLSACKHNKQFLCYLFFGIVCIISQYDLMRYGMYFVL